MIAIIVLRKGLRMELLIDSLPQIVETVGNMKKNNGPIIEEIVDPINNMKDINSYLYNPVQTVSKYNEFNNNNVEDYNKKFTENINYQHVPSKNVVFNQSETFPKLTFITIISIPVGLMFILLTMKDLAMIIKFIVLIATFIHCCIAARTSDSIAKKTIA